MAVMKQQIELLNLQVKETEAREEQQRNMYERMFQALDIGGVSLNAGADEGRNVDI